MTLARLAVFTILCCTCLPALAARAGTAVEAHEFEKYTTGKTFHYRWMGREYGVEEYLPGRKVRWLSIGSECVEGHWYEDDGNICFSYQNRSTPQCWRVEINANGMMAQYVNDPAMEAIYEIGQSDEPLICPGPRIGV